MQTGERQKIYFLNSKEDQNKLKLEYEKIDPELDPNAAANYGVNSFPSIVVEALDSRRSQIILVGAQQFQQIHLLNKT